MFNMQNIGQKICKARKEANMTQMELADKLNISFQAVSNWEKGQSSPDISKLPELCSILNISIDELLGHNKIVENIINENLNEYLENEKIDVSEFIEVAPILKPKQNDAIFESIYDIVSKDTKIHIDDLICLAPFISEDILNSIFVSYQNNIKVENFEDFVGLAPFLSKSVISDFLVDTINGNNARNIEDLVGFAPFLDSEFLCNILIQSYKDNKITDIENLVGFAPFLNKNDLNNFITEVLKDNKFKDIDGLVAFAPFICKDMLGQLLQDFYKNGKIDDINDLVGFAPFVSKEDLTNFITNVLENDNFNNISDLIGFMPFISNNNEIIEKIIKKIGIKESLPFLTYFN